MCVEEVGGVRFSFAVDSDLPQIMVCLNSHKRICQLDTKVISMLLLRKKLGPCKQKYLSDALEKCPKSQWQRRETAFQSLSLCLFMYYSLVWFS